MVARLDQFGAFLVQLGQHIGGAGPVKADAGGAVLQLDRARHRRQPKRHAVQHALFGAARAFPGLDFFPVFDLLFGGFVAVFIAKDMGVTADQLVRDLACNVVKGKHPLFFCHLRMKHHLKQQVAQFAGKFVPCLPRDGVGDLMRFFNRIGRD